MCIMKFGGTSVGSPERMKKLVNLISSYAKKIVVLSAVSGRTNQLEAIGQLLIVEKSDEAESLIIELQNFYERFMNNYSQPNKGKIKEKR